MSRKRNYFKDVLLGISVADALGVPVEFKSRESLTRNPITGMIGYGSHQQPAGTWSDDSSLTFCLAEALLSDFNLHTIADNFIKWLYKNYWTAHGEIFDVGNTTREAIGRLLDGTNPELAGGFYADENGNGSLMRILPLVFHIKNKSISERYSLTKQVSSLTHGHIRSVTSCFYYLEFARHLIDGKDKFETYESLKSIVKNYLSSLMINPVEVNLFDRLLKDDIHSLKEENIQSSGYVLHTLEACVWCLLTTENYNDAVLKAVNLGYDTDTTAACTGGLAGLLYGYDTIPTEWVENLVKVNDIVNLANRMDNYFE